MPPSKIEKGLFSTIGQTPLVPLQKLYPKSSLKIYAKLEMFNPGGSIKDRPARMMLSKALDERKLSPNHTVIESSSGNMAIGLAQACRYLGLELIVVVDPKINHHTQKLLQTYGAKISTVQKPDEHGNYLSARLERVQQLLQSIPDSYWPNQYANIYNPAAHYQTMHEISEGMSRPLDYLLVATSTCGTIMGCSNYVQKNNLDTKIIAVDAVGSVIFGHSSANRMIPGHGAGRPSQLLNKDAIDDVLHLTDEDCISGCRRLINREAILAGGSSGAVVTAVQKLQSTIPNEATCGLILADSGERYLDTIYSDEWVLKHFTNTTIANDLESHRKTHSPLDGSSGSGIDDQNTDPHKIAIIGGGPKGIFGLERLAAQFNRQPPEEPVEIHVYNKNSFFGAGEIYHPGQPEYLFINNSVGDINMWIDETPPPVTDNPTSCTKWLQINVDEHITGKDYVGRASVGRYLMDGFQQILQNLPPKVRVKLFVGEVQNITPQDNDYCITLHTADGKARPMPHRYDYILLATGHPKNKRSKAEDEFQNFADNRENISYTPFIYPVKQRLHNIRNGDEVAIKGLGLTFVDAVLALTEGRGGTFVPVKDNAVPTYQPSGNEPEVIFPFSRSGLPMIPRGPVPADAPPLKFFTHTSLEALQAQSKTDELNFKTQIEPLLKQEMIYAFYNTKVDKDLTACRNFAEVRNYIHKFHARNPETETFIPADFLNPLNNKKFLNTEDYNDFITSYWQFFVGQAQKGEIESPWAAVTAVWRKATPLFGRFYAFGGLTPASQQYFDTQFRPKLNRVTFGPPVQSIREMLALIKHGLLRFDMAKNPSVSINHSIDSFVLQKSDSSEKKQVNHLVNARISKVSILGDESPLYRNLLEKGMIQIFKNETESQSYTPGCLALSPQGFVINARGKTNTQIAVTGTPSEGVTFDNDALSRTRNNFVSEWAAFVRKSIFTSCHASPHVV
jgi:2,3-diaminopropionate biosynthesis protein SbnA